MEGEGKVEEKEGSAKKQVYGDYEIVRPIGKGKFAIVYRAQRISDGEIVALKRISVDMIDAKARDKCLKEVGLLQSLDHPNIIRYLDSFISDDDLVIVVEWAAAGDLKRQLRKAQEKSIPFEERIIWKYFSQIADAIKHMHEKRIMHRDLKPANIFLTLDGTIKVGDLGLSRELSEHTVQAHSKVGTPLYMSPEVLRGDGYDFKSDTWSLGCLLYELAMLKSPFKAEGLNLYSLFQKISQGDYQPLPEDYSEELRNLADSMMSTKSEDRPDLTDVCVLAAKMRQKYADKHQRNKRAAAGKSTISGRVNSLNDTKSSRSESEKNSPSASKSREVTAEDIAHQPIAATGKSDHVADNDTYKSSASETKYDGAEDTPVVNTNKFQRFGPKATAVESATPTNYLGGAGTAGSLQSAAVPAPTKQPRQSENVQRRVKPTEKNSISGKSVPRSGKVERPSSREVGNSGNDEQLSMDNDAFVQPSGRRPASSEKNSLKQNAIAAVLKDSSPAYSSMSSLYDKMTILGYGTSTNNEGEEYRMLPFQFAAELTQVGLANRRHLLPPGSPFLFFVTTASWLFKKVESAGKGYHAPTFEAEDGPPLAIAKHILLETQACGVPPSGLADIPATSLLPGFGLKVCQLLNLIADQALSALRHKWKPFVYSNPEGSNDPVDAAGGDEIDDGEIAEDVPETEYVEDENEEMEGKSSAYIGHSMIFPDATVQPSEWKAETERVTSKLLARRISSAGSGGWAENLMNLSKHAKVAHSDSEETIVESLRLLVVHVKDSMSSLTRIEQQLNSKASTSSVKAEFTEYRKEFESLEERHKIVSDKVLSLTNSLADISEMADDLSEQVTGKATNGREGGDGGIVNLRDAIKTLKSEIIGMNTTTGLLSTELLKCRQNRIANKMQREARKRKSRLMLHGVKALSTSFGGEDTDSSL